MRKHPLWKQAWLPTLLLLLTVWLINFFPAKFEFVKAIKQELGDFDIYDLHYSGRTHTNHMRDSNIVIVQVGDSREEIAKQLELLNTYQPAVIGIDVDFKAPGNDSVTDLRLKSIILNNPGVISGYLLVEDQDSHKLKAQANFFDNESTLQKAGYFNFIGEKISVVRNYSPFIKLDSATVPSFTSRILEKFDPAVFADLKKKGINNPLLVNYSGNMERFTVISKEMLFSDSSGQFSDLLKGRIVLLGVVYPRPPEVLEDLHFTPLNDKVNGKSFPDMYGVLVHANILSMAIARSYFKRVSNWITYIIAAVFIFLIAIWQLRSTARKEHVGHWKLILFQLGSILLLTYLCLLIFSNFHVRMELLPLIISIVLGTELFGNFHQLGQWLMARLKPVSSKKHKPIHKK